MNEDGHADEALTCKWRLDGDGWWLPPCLPFDDFGIFRDKDVISWLFCPFCGASIEFKEEA